VVNKNTNIILQTTIGKKVFEVKVFGHVAEE
jgi:hypothetical protein